MDYVDMVKLYEYKKEKSTEKRLQKYDKKVEKVKGSFEKLSCDLSVPFEDLVNRVNQIKELVDSRAEILNNNLGKKKAWKRSQDKSELALKMNPGM